jgi:hypothetical protein
MTSLARRAALALALFSAAAWVAHLFVEVRPLSHWFLPRYLSSWMATLLFAAASYAVGLRLIGWLWPAGV